MKHNIKRHQGFTLIELLVVISIIAILATIATPTIGKAREKARQVPILANARSIVQALQDYAGAESGAFPVSTTEDSNGAFRKLFPGHMDGGGEKTFHVAQDKIFCKPQPPDTDIGGGDGDDSNSNALVAGENHWSYVAGLTDSDDSKTPIIADGFTGGNGEYDKFHTFWKSKNALVGYLDVTARAEKLTVSGDKGYVKHPTKPVNLFTPEALTEMGTARVLNPLRSPTAPQN